jgi:hypothetical protein
MLHFVVVLSMEYPGSQDPTSHRPSRAAHAPMRSSRIAKRRQRRTSTALSALPYSGFGVILDSGSPRTLSTQAKIPISRYSFLSCYFHWLNKKVNYSTRYFEVIRKSAQRRVCALGRAWRCFRYKDIEHILKSEHEYTLLRLPRTMASMVIFP